MKRVLVKLWRADGQRKTRFHDHKNETDIVAIATEFPLSLWERFICRAPSWNAPRPWIPRRASEALQSLTSRDSEIVEFGAGFSTLWWSSRVRSVTSYECDEGWTAKVSAYLTKSSASNVAIHPLNRAVESAPHAISSAALTVIDGPERYATCQLVLKHAPSESFVYLDNSDRSAIDPEYAHAQSALLARSSWHNAYKGFPPFTLFLCEGMLFKLK